MSTTTGKICAILIALAMLFASAPVGACHDADERPAEAAGCACEAEPSPCEDTDESGCSSDDDCCTSDCVDCFHSCCVGLLSLPALSESFGADRSFRGALQSYDEVSTPAHARSVDHPPNI